MEMKKIFVVVFLVLGSSLFGIDHGLISGFEVGWNMDKIITLEKDDYSFSDASHDSLYLQIKTGYRVENFRIMGTYTNTMNILSVDSYNPIQDRFRIDINYTFKSFTIGAFHWCDHSVVTQADQRTISSDLGQRSIYIRFYKEL
jgi:hypothetical protein